MVEIGLVTNHHDDYVGVRVVAELTQPPLHIFECLFLCNVVDKEGTHCPTIVRASYGAVAFLASSIPYLGLDCFPFYLQQ